MSMKKILYVITKGTWGGAQRYVFDLATSLPRDEFEVEVAIGEDGLLREKLATKNIKTVSISELQRDISLRKEIGSFFTLYNVFRTSRPDVVHLSSSKAGALGALAARIAGISHIIFTVHGWPFNENRNWLWKTVTWLASYTTALLSTDLIVIASPDFEQVKAMPFIMAKTHLIPNGIKTPEFLSREEARRKLEIRPDALVVGSIGELTWNKNYPELVMVAASLFRERFNFEFAAIGEGEDRDEILAEITKHKPGSPVLDGHRILRGFKEDAYTYLKAFDIFVLNSRKEGLPYVILEAGAAGLPVAATSVGGIPDIIENDKTGLLAPPYRMIDALRKLLEEQEMRERLGSALKERVEKKFSFEQMRAKTLAVYEKIIR